MKDQDNDFEGEPVERLKAVTTYEICDLLKALAPEILSGRGGLLGKDYRQNARKRIERCLEYLDALDARGDDLI